MGRPGQATGRGLVAPSSGKCSNHRRSPVSFLLLFGDVAAIVEVAEEDDEGDAVAEHQHVHGVWEVTVR